MLLAHRFHVNDPAFHISQPVEEGIEIDSGFLTCFYRALRQPDSGAYCQAAAETERERLEYRLHHNGDWCEYFGYSPIVSLYCEKVGLNLRFYCGRSKVPPYLHGGITRPADRQSREVATRKCTRVGARRQRNQSPAADLAMGTCFSLLLPGG